jgi:hypothetical protein
MIRKKLIENPKQYHVYIFDYLKEKKVFNLNFIINMKSKYSSAAGLPASEK